MYIYIYMYVYIYIYTCIYIYIYRRDCWLAGQAGAGGTLRSP